MRSFIIIALVLLAASASAQNLSVFNLDATNFPTMKAKFYAFDANGVQQSPSPSEITVTEDGITRNVTSITCPPKKDPSPITLGIMVDTYSGIDLAKEGAQKLINLLSIPPSEAGITMMDHGAFIVQDLTQKTSKLQTAIAKLQPAPGVDLQTMFYAPNAGGVPFVSGRPNKKVLVLITDLHCPLLNLDKAQLFKDAAKENISIYVILLGTNDEYGYSKEITSKTGGILFERISGEQQLDKAISTIITNVDSLLPCDLSWESSSGCDLTRNVIFTYKNIGIDTLSYTEPAVFIPELSFSNYGVEFGQIGPGFFKDITIVITAKNLPITITDISISDNSFKILNGSAPPSFTLSPGQSKQLTIRYTPKDSSYKFEKLTITSNACLSNPIYLIGGFASQKDSIARMTLLQPNGGEKFAIRDTEIIRWTNTYLDDTVSISYSIDNGKTWTIITDSASGYSYKWVLPATPSDSCLVKIREHRKLRLDSVLGLAGLNYGWHVEFSPDGLYVLGTDLTHLAIIWDAQTGKLVHRLTGHNGPILDGSFSPDGTKVATASGSGDGTAKIWDVVSGSLLQTLSGHKGDVNTVRFNIDGSRVVTSSKDSTAIMWDIQTGAQLTIFKGHIDWVNSAIFSPFGDKVYTAGQEGYVKIWDAATGKMLFNLNGKGYAIDAIALNHKGDLISSVNKIHIDNVWNTNDGSLFHSYSPAWGFTQFSSDDQMLLSATDYKAYVWNTSNGKTINSFDAYPIAISCGAFSPDNRFVVTSSGALAQCWDMGTGDLLISLRGHSNAIHSLGFNKTLYELATISPDTVKLWFLHYRPDQYDISDSVFSIIAPTFSFASNVIDLGQVETFTEKDSVVKATICNSGGVPLHVLGMDVTGGDKKDFMIMSGAGDFTLQPGECRDVMFSFMPMLTGKFSATVTLRTSNGDYPDTIKILGEGIAPQLAVMGSVIDFGQVKIGSFKDTTIVIAIQNIGKTSVTFSPASQLGPDIKQFIPQSASGFSLAPNATESITLRFAPHFIGRTSGRIAYTYNGPSSPAILNVYGQGLGGLVSIADDSGYAGDHKNIPMILGKVPVTSVQSEATNFSARIAYDRTVLYPSSGSVQHGARFDTITVSGSIGSDSILANLPFVAMLGDSKTSPMNIVDFSWLDGSGNPADFDVETESGTFYMLGICPAGGARLYNPDGQVSMAHITPNPVNGMMHIDIQTTEVGITKLALVNLLGATVATISDSELKPGAHSFDVNTNSLSAGSYFLMMQTPTVRRMQRVNVEK